VVVPEVTAASVGKLALEVDNPVSPCGQRSNPD